MKEAQAWLAEFGEEGPDSGSQVGAGKQPGAPGRLRSGLASAQQVRPSLCSGRGLPGGLARREDWQDGGIG